MENPYEKKPDRETYAAQVLRMDKGIAWIEGYLKGKAEQAEIVRGLVEACEMARALVMIQGADQPELYESEGFVELKGKLEAAIASATQ